MLSGANAQLQRKRQPVRTQSRRAVQPELLHLQMQQQIGRARTRRHQRYVTACDAVRLCCCVPRALVARLLPCPAPACRAALGCAGVMQVHPFSRASE